MIIAGSSGDRPEPSRRTIGMLIDNPAYIPGIIWQGAVQAAAQRDVNLICFAGQALHDPNAVVAQGNIIYQLINPGRLDGLIVAAASLGTFLGPGGMEAFCQQYAPLPIVSTGAPIPESPCVFIDDYLAMREVVTHLIEVHKYHRIAFIRGPAGHSGAQRRFQAYLDVLDDYGLPHDDALISPPAPHWRGLEIPADMVSFFLDRRRTPMDAMVAVCDEIGVGVIKVLKGRGLRVPEDIAVTGFDNIFTSTAIRPSLTTVCPPFGELGRTALDFVLRMIAGKQVPEITRLPTKLVIRQSCGCPNQASAHASTHTLEYGPVEQSETTFVHQRDQIVTDMTRILEDVSCSQASEWAARLFDAFLTDLHDSPPHHFIEVFTSTLHDFTTLATHPSEPLISFSEDHTTCWQNLISELRTQAYACLPPSAPWQVLENIWHQARVLIDEVTNHIQRAQTATIMEQTGHLQELASKLTAIPELDQFMEILAAVLPQFGVRSGYLALYDQKVPCLSEEQQTLPVWSRLFLGYHGGQLLNVEELPARFVSQQLLPEGVFPLQERYSLLVQPLYFRTEQLGFMIFEAGSHRRDLYEALRLEISSALHSTLLMKHIRTRTEELAATNAKLARQHSILDTFLENVPDRIYFKDRQSRVIQGNAAYAAVFGFQNPAEVIGKTDFDFFPEPIARTKYEQEQEIMRSGQPLVSIEEPGAKGCWALSTKMPLRDEHGEIIGTFGISRDITDLKQAQKELQTAYNEIEMRVQERTTELQQEIGERQRAEQEIRRLQNFLKNIIDSMPSVLVSVDAEGYVTQWNLEAQQITGIPATAAQGQLLSDVFPELGRKLPDIRQAIHARIIHKAVTLTYSRNGETRQAELTLYPLLANGVEGAVIRVDDITERIRLEEIMIRSEKMMTVGGLAAGMAHEINNPLGIILQGIQNTTRRLSPEMSTNQDVARTLGIDLSQLQTYLQQRHILDYLEGIREAGLQASKIVHEMLNFSRPHEAEKIPVNLNHLLDHMLDLAANEYDLKKKYNFRNFTIIRQYDPTLPMVACMPNEIEHVMLNLLRNAAQALAEAHASNTQPCIRIITTYDDADASISIEDNGTGMDAATRQRAFEPFFTTKAVGEGTGLGLSVCYFIIVTHHQGDIQIESEPGKGTRLHIRLPLS